MKRFVQLGGLAAATVLLSACATVTRGTSQKFAVQSTPSEAEVTLSTGQQCVTPCKLKLKRRPGFTATVKKQGYKTQTLTVDSKLAGGGAVAGAGNLLVGGLIGGIVDGSNGSMNNLTPNPLVVTLVPEEGAVTAAVAEPVTATAVEPAPEQAAEPAAAPSTAEISSDVAAPSGE